MGKENKMCFFQRVARVLLGDQFFRDSLGEENGLLSNEPVRDPSGVRVPSSWLAVVNRGILELTRDVYTDDRRILLVLNVISL